MLQDLARLRQREDRCTYTKHNICLLLEKVNERRRRWQLLGQLISLTASSYCINELYHVITRVQHTVAHVLHSIKLYFEPQATGEDKGQCNHSDKLRALVMLDRRRLVKSTEPR